MTMQHVLEFLEKTFREYSFRSGYIGNCGYDGDHRSFRIWCEDVHESDGWGGTQMLHISLGGQEDIDNRSDNEWILLLMRACVRIERAAEREVSQ